MIDRSNLHNPARGCVKKTHPLAVIFYIIGYCLVYGDSSPKRNDGW